MWLSKYPDGGTVPKPKAKGKYVDPLRPQGLGVQVQDNLRPMPLADIKAIDESNTLPAKFNKSLVRAKQETKRKEVGDAEIARRKALIAKSNTDGGFKNSAVAEKMRVFPNSAGGWGEVFDDYANLPRVLIGQSADALGHAKSPSEFAQAAIVPIAAGMLGYSPLNTAINIVKSPVTRVLASAPGHIYNSVIDGNMGEFNALQRSAHTIEAETYNTLRNVNKAGNLYKNTNIPLDERINKMIGLDIPEENIIRMTGKTRQELLQEASEFQNIKKAREENPGLDSRNLGSINLTRTERRARLDAESMRILNNERGYSVNEIFTPAEQDAMRFNLDRTQPRLSEAEIRQRIQSNLQSSLPQYGEIDLNEVIYGSAQNTPRMQQMQKANDLADGIMNVTNKISNRNFSKQYIPKYNGKEPVKDLIPSITRHMDAKAEQTIMKKVSEIGSGNSGDLFRGASSLSDGSFPAYMKNLQKQVQNGVGEPLYGGHSTLNTMGFLSNSGVAKSDITGYLNKYIGDFNRATGKNIPKAYMQDEFIHYPDVIFKKFEHGGTIKNWLNKY